MRINSVTDKDKLYFRSIKLSQKELNKADAIINQLLLPDNIGVNVNTLYKKFFDVLYPHLKNEAQKRAGRFYLADEIFSELTLKLAEIIKNLISYAKTENILQEINNYKPSKYAYKPEYTVSSLNTSPYTNEHELEKIDLITEENLPRPESQITIERYHTIIENLIKKSKLSELQEKRLRGRAAGVTIKSLSEEDNVSTQVVKSAINKSILKIQNQENIIPEKVIKKIKVFSNILGCSAETFKKTVLIRPDLLAYKPETLKKNIETTSKLLGYPQDKILKYALKYPSLFYQKPETFMNNINKSAKIIGCTEEEFKKSALRLPEIILRSPHSLKANIQGSASVLNCSEEKLKEVALRHPQIFLKKPDVMINNTKLFSNLFNISFEESVKILMKYPALFYRNLFKIKERVKLNAQALNLEEDCFLKTALKSPILLCLHPDKISRNYSIMNYYRKLQNIESQCLSPVLSDDMWYTKMLTNFINDKERSKVIKPRSVSPAKLEEYLKNNPDKTYSFTIPEGFAAKSLVNFAEKISQKTLGKNIFNIEIVE